MSESILELLNETKTRAERFVEVWRGVGSQVDTQLRSDYLPYRENPQVSKFLEKNHAEFCAMDDLLAHHFQRLIDDLLRPELTIATTGTTSSGKSALVNLLIGAEILPVAVQEMSAGVVTVRHGPSVVLTIHPTEGAKWETGTWNDLDDSSLRERLHDVMVTYLEVRNREGSSNGYEPADLVAPPIFEIQYPTWIGNHPEKLGLPTGCRFRLLDLPGMKFIGDESNLRVIREYVKEALCLVTYNSAETDPTRQKALLEQVVQEVKHLGGSPARMLFILNRIDEFAKDFKGQSNEEAFALRMTESIKKILADSLPEYSTDIAKISPLPLSTLPALFALRLRNGLGASAKYDATKLLKHFNFLIPEDVLEDLPYKPEKWTEHQCRRVGEAVWVTSRAGAFFDALSKHIRHNLPHLLITPLVHRFAKDCGQHLTRWVVNTASAQLNASQQQYQQQVARLKEAGARLDEMLKEKEQHLLEHFNKIMQDLQTNSDARTLFMQISQTLRDFCSTPPFNLLPKEAVEPLVHWQESMKNDCLKALRAIINGLETGEYADLGMRLPPHGQFALMRSIESFRGLGYRLGETREIIATTTIERLNAYQHLQQLHNALEVTEQHCRIVMQEITAQEAAHQQQRMREAIRRIVEVYWDDINSSASCILRDCGVMLYSTIAFDSSVLDKAHDKAHHMLADVRYQFTMPTRISEQKPHWLLWWLWLDSYRIRVTIPSRNELLTTWEAHLRTQDASIMQHLSKWIADVLSDVAKSLRQTLKNALRQYAQQLREAHDLARQRLEESSAPWQSILNRASELQKSLKDLLSVCARRE